MLPFFSIASGYAVSEGISRNGLRKFGYLLLFVLLFSNIAEELVSLQTAFRPFSVIMGTESKHDYLSRQLPTFYPITNYANENLPFDAKILFIGETRGYYSDRVFIAGTAHDRTPIVDFAYEARDAEDLHKRLKASGITHLIFNKREIARLNKQYNYFNWKTEEDMKKFSEFYHQHVKILTTINDSELLEIL